MRMESPLNQRLRRSPPDVVYTPFDVTSNDMARPQHIVVCDVQLCGMSSIRGPPTAEGLAEGGRHFTDSRVWMFRHRYLDQACVAVYVTLLLNVPTSSLQSTRRQ